MSANLTALKNLSLTSQILLAPAVTIVLIIGLIAFSLDKLTEIKQQNETVREWVRICSHTASAISAGERMTDIAKQLQGKTVDKDDDLHFNYLESSRSFADNLRYTALRARLDQNTASKLRQVEDIVRYRDDLKPAVVRSSLQDLLPRLDRLYRGFRVQKRAAYTNYYDNVNKITSQLATISLSVLALSVISGIAVSVWTIRRTKQRLGHLAQNARNICAGNLDSPESPDRVRDELDELASCMSTMTQRLLKVVATEKVLEGAEEERRRIAMDIHDQALADLTGLTRGLRSLRDDTSQSSEERQRRIDALESELEEVANNIRSIIDDLHPQALDLLGLEKALRSYAEKHLTGPAMPNHFLHIDPGIDEALTGFQRLSLYRIILNAVSNIVRHARATRYEIDCRLNQGILHVVVEDNGIGFDYEQARRNGGRGLINIEERAKAIGATVKWGPARFSTGTRLDLTLDTRIGP